MPDNAYLYNFIVCACMVCACMASLARRLPKARKRVRQMIVLSMVNLTALFGITLSTYLQSGWFEGAAACHFVQLLAVMWVLFHHMVILIMPIFAMHPELSQRAQRAMQVLVWVIIIVQGVPILVMLATARSAEHRETYNNAAASFLLALPVITVFCIALSINTIRQLRARIAALGNIKSDKGDSVRSNVLGKIERIETFTLTRLPLALVGAAWPIAHLVLGSAPWFFIEVWSVFSINYVLFARGIVLGFMNRDRSDVSGKQPSSNLKTTSEGNKQAATLVPVDRALAVGPVETAM